MNKNRFITNDIAVLYINDDVLLGYESGVRLQKLAKTIGSKGRYISEIRTVKNIPSVIISNIKEVAERYQLLIVVGSIGVMHDCHATFCIADALSLSLEENQDAKQMILNVLKRDGIKYFDACKRAFELPRGSLAIPNEVTGIAGYRVQNIIALPADSSFDETCNTIVIDLCSWYKSYMHRIVFTQNPLGVAQIVENFARNHSDVGVQMSCGNVNEVILTATDFDNMQRKVDIMKEMLLLQKT